MTEQKIFFFLYFLCLSVCCIAQTGKFDSLRQSISAGTNDTNKVNNLLRLSNEYMNSSPNDALRISNEAKDLAVDLKYTTGVAYAQKNIGMVFYNQTKYVETIEHWMQSYLLV